MRATIAFFIILLSIGGCANRGSETDSQTARSAAGAALGAAAAVAGTAALGAPRPLVIGAGIGGAALGYYLTSTNFDAGPINRAGGQIYVQGEYVGVSIPSYVLFETNSADFTPDAEALLDSAVAVLKRYPNNNILVSGNTSGFGSHRYDQNLSTARARQVASYLWAHGINNFKNQNNQMRKLNFVGYGDYFPIANSTKSRNIQKNSRIQITSYPSQVDLKLNKESTVFNNMGGFDS